MAEPTLLDVRTPYNDRHCRPTPYFYPSSHFSPTRPVLEWHPSRSSRQSFHFFPPSFPSRSFLASRSRFWRHCVRDIESTDLKEPSPPICDKSGPAFPLSLLGTRRPRATRICLMTSFESRASASGPFFRFSPSTSEFLRLL